MEGKNTGVDRREGLPRGMGVEKTGRKRERRVLECADELGGAGGLPEN